MYTFKTKCPNYFLIGKWSRRQGTLSQTLQGIKNCLAKPRTLGIVNYWGVECKNKLSVVTCSLMEQVTVMVWVHIACMSASRSPKRLLFPPRKRPVVYKWDGGTLLLETASHPEEALNQQGSSLFTCGGTMWDNHDSIEVVGEEKNNIQNIRSPL